MSRILLVDDNPDCCLSLAALLRCRNHEVVPASSGELALRFAARQSFDFVLLDLLMPEMDGYEVAQRLRQDDTARVGRIIAVTGYWPVGGFGPSPQFDDFLLKPVDLDKLSALLSQEPVEPVGCRG